MGREEHPAVFDAAVDGLPDERLGERPAAAVVLEPNATLTLEELKSISGNVEWRSIPGRLHPMDKLPTSTVGKLNKRLLRELLG
ncbi:AMP-binding enzyme [Nocardia carnea]|uniref:AMP-binding enzyme n=1 Tax=Nocardia carnea TaxID=37328 RepID=UPI00245593A1|nr:hypothetical protein [Nocardia carnea]